MFDLEGNLRHIWYMKYPFCMGYEPAIKVDIHGTIYIANKWESVFRVLDNDGNYLLRRELVPPLSDHVLPGPSLEIVNNYMYLAAVKNFPHLMKFDLRTMIP